jgi:ABC-type transport system substrate-binding protein
MTAVAGTDPANWRDGIGLFGAGTPFASDVGIEVLRSPRDYPAVKQALAQAGYKGERIVVIAPTDALVAVSRIGAEQLRRAGLKIDYQEMDFGSVVRRRTNQAPPDKGGWNAHCFPARSFFGGFRTPASIPGRPLEPGRHPKPFTKSAIRRERGTYCVPSSHPTLAGLSRAGIMGNSGSASRCEW